MFTIFLSKAQKAHIQVYEKLVSSTYVKQIRALLRANKVGVVYQTTKLGFVSDQKYPQLHKISEHVSDQEIDEINSATKQAVYSQLYKEFAPQAPNYIARIIAPEITHLDGLKELLTLQLFSEQAHILIIGDHGADHVQIVRQSTQLHPQGLFCPVKALYKEKQQLKALLTNADEGVVTIIDYELLDAQDRKTIEQTITRQYIQKGPHRHDVRAQLLGVSSPVGKQFVGSMLSTLKNQLPKHREFFSLQVCIRLKTKHPNSFEPKTVSIEQKEFIRDYILYAQSTIVDFPAPLQETVVKWVSQYDDSQKIIEKHPLLAKTIILLAKGRARTELRKVVTKKDVEQVCALLETIFE
ncbi:MAG: hypothetical protein ACMXYF_00900 [Candidatus Woesearchaeota archaeon]